jgi:hypothetical protein
MCDDHLELAVLKIALPDVVLGQPRNLRHSVDLRGVQYRPKRNMRFRAAISRLIDAFDAFCSRLLST